MGKFFKKEIIQNTSTIEVNEYLLSETQLQQILQTKKNVLLVEPLYKRKYVPLGLAKIAAFIKQNNNRFRYTRTVAVIPNIDCICVTSLFTYDASIVLETINSLLHYYKNIPIIIGGIYASLMPKHLLQNIDKVSNIKIFKGCASFLDNTPALFDFDWKVDAPWDDFSFCFTSRGCPNKCSYCAVWKIEPESTLIEHWKDQINFDKANIMISDNNLFSQNTDHIADTLDYLYKINKKIIFDNGFDCKLMTDKWAKKLARLKIYQTGMRLAFDRIEEDGVFQTAVTKLIAHGMKSSSIMAYVLFNFNDTPKGADYRARTCVNLKIRPYPQRFVPLTYSERKETHFVGKYWSDNLAKAFRYFWLMGGLYRKTEFSDFIQTTRQFKLTPHDIELYFNSPIK